MNKQIKQLISEDYMRSLLERCLAEDGGLSGDVTTNALGLSGAKGSFAVNIRGMGVVACLEPLVPVLDVFGDVAITTIHCDGDVVQNENIALLEGEVQSILIAERTILNILGHASGIATRTKMFVDAVVGTNCNVCDTRKTTPGLRLLDKYAVQCGGGTAHRMGLHDAALFKDNHLAGFDDLHSELGAAITCAKEYRELQFIEVEVDTIAQLEEVITLPVDIILLDNMSKEELAEAVSIRDASCASILLEASGGVNLETVRAIAQTGVDRVSIGGLIHQATWVDVGLDALHA
jgi:nicotinate-nucleotide pyrophosphorylase (carboxylating)